MSPDTPERQYEEVTKLFLQKSPAGQPCFTKAEIRHFLPLVILSAGYDSKATPTLVPLMNDFFAKLKLPAKTDNAAFARAVHAYYRRYPPNRELERQFFAYCRSQANGELDPAQVKKYVKTAKPAPVRATTQAAIAAPKPPAKVGFFGTIGNLLKGPD